MSAKQTDLREDIQRLIDEKYAVEIQHSHLLIHSVPYATQDGTVARGILVCKYDAQSVGDHQMSFQGSEPCYANGKRLEQLINNSNRQVIYQGFETQHNFSNKPLDVPNFPRDYYEKVMHYVSILTAQARVIEPDADARVEGFVPKPTEQSVFKYGDIASARAGITAISQKLELSKVAIVGLGGTGSYILDQVAKTYVKEIHLFDGDEFKTHNAFRSPGAAAEKNLERQCKKVDYFSHQYSVMRHGIYAHSYYISEENINELSKFDFVFVCVDSGYARKLITDFIREKNIAFIDVGMNLNKTDELSLRGMCRVTLGYKENYDHLPYYLPTDPDDDDDLYKSNIQVSEMNAINAMLAVIRWKQHFGFYECDENPVHLSFSPAMLAIARKK